MNVPNFYFSFQQAQSVKDDLKKEVDSFEERISSIVDSEKFFINNFPVLKQILTLSPDPSDLKKLAKALDRLAHITQSYKEVSSKYHAIETLTQNPHWFAGSLGDFSQEVENFIGTTDFKD
jgi:alpha/beta superfamily hydrolase